MKAPAEPARKSPMPSQTDAGPRRGILTGATPADRGLVELPALVPHLQFHEIGEQQALLVSESFNTLLHGRLYCDLLPLLDGRRGQGFIQRGACFQRMRLDVPGNVEIGIVHPLRMG